MEEFPNMQEYTKHWVNAHRFVGGTARHTDILVGGDWFGCLVLGEDLWPSSFLKDKSNHLL